jgi:outer membrane lipoprotein-sorting protein
MVNQQEQVEESLAALGACLRRQRSVRDLVVQRLAQVGGREMAFRAPWHRGRAVRAAGALAACALLFTAAWFLVGGGGAAEVLAAAVDRVRQAKTFSCRQILERTDANNNTVRKAQEELLMFKEPDRARHEWVEGSALGHEVTIEDYGRRRQLHLNPRDKVAALADTSSSYEVDRQTGKPEITRLDVSLRDRLIKMPTRPAEDLGEVKLGGRTARLLQSKRGETLYKMWVDPRSRLPLQIQIIEPQYRQRWTYASIEIDAPLDDKLFSLDVPEGYSLFRGQVVKPIPEREDRMMAKMMEVGRACCVFAANHGDRFPKELGDLRETGIKEEVLKRLLAAENDPNGPPVILYRRPRDDDRRDAGDVILLYEAHDKWPKDGVVVGFKDGHCSQITDRKRFEELMR